ncbi:DoxX family membrane protein [Gillisia sp. JM1]|uniref:DoxX family membrane protein n=1 Tax=Gillisia sp. JM1 TaxID=1283286 RepID=UPI000422DF70|nr:DoxX family membrane protein [Gillisia sp. JM1]
MSKISKLKLDSMDYAISKWMYSYGKPILRFSLAIIFIWFGYLKVILDSPAQELVANTVYWLDPEVFIPILGIWEMLIGIFLCFRLTIRLAILLLVLQMPGTFLPLVILPEVCFVKFPLILSMEGQYIIKNLVLISAGIVIGGTLREKEMISKKYTSADAG